MTKQLKQQRDELIENTQQIEERRQLFDSVLSSVTSGVVVLDQEGRVNFTNSAASILITERRKIESQISLADAFPELNSLFQQLKKSGLNNLQDEIKLVRAGRLENFLVRMATMNEEKKNHRLCGGF